LRTDGGTLYATRDLAAAIYRYKTFNFDKALYLTALDQNLHFAQFFKVLELMGYDFYDKLVHVPFGLVSLETGKLSTRKGQVILMEDLLNESVTKTLEIIKERCSGTDAADDLEEQEIAKMVGIGAVIFNELYNGRVKDVLFSWDKMLNFNGETGPYVQYTQARANSLLKKFCNEYEINTKIDFSHLAEGNAVTIIKQIYGMKDKITDAAEKNEPSVISRQLVDLCQSFNKFYNEEPILKAEKDVRDARILLVMCVRDVIKSILGLICIKAPERM
jgi:arginyl-tRNA synthetase